MIFINFKPLLDLYGYLIINEIYDQFFEMNILTIRLRVNKKKKKIILNIY